MMHPQQHLSPNSALDDIPEFLEHHHHRASSRDRRLVNGSSFDHRSAPTSSRHSRSRPVVTAAPHRNSVPTPRRRASTATTASSSTDQSSGFDYSQYPESVSTAPTFGSDPNGEGFGFLPCEFVGYTHCDYQYDLADTEQWMNHIIEDHLSWQLPEICACWYCDDFIFDSRQNGLDVVANFRERLYHISGHINTGNVGVTAIRPDFNFIDHIWGLRMITPKAYNEAVKYTEGPKSNPGGIYRYDYMPAERQNQQDRIASVVVNESSHGRRGKKGHHQ